MLYLREENPEFDASLGAVDALLSTPESSLLEDEFWKAMQEHKHRKNESTGQMEPHPLVVKCAQDIINTPTKERGSVLSTTRNTVALYRDEIISKNTSVSEFCIKDLMNYADPVTLYIITEETDKERVKPLFRLLLAMICRKLASGMTYEKIGESRRAKSPNTHKLLMLIDEFPSTRSHPEVLSLPGGLWNTVLLDRSGSGAAQKQGRGIWGERGHHFELPHSGGVHAAET